MRRLKLAQIMAIGFSLFLAYLQASVELACSLIAACGLTWIMVLSAEAIAWLIQEDPDIINMP